MQITLQLGLFFLLPVLCQGQANGQDFEPYTQELPGLAINFKFLPVKGGQFQMGSSRLDKDTQPDELPAHTVNISDFWMSAYETTWEQYDTFVFQELDSLLAMREEQMAPFGIDGVSGASPPYVDMSFGMGKGNYPAVNMTQYGAIMFCKWLTAKTGVFYRLPTEAEWEYACKAGALNDEVPLVDRAWYKKNTEFQYERVGTKLPDNLGLFDVLGNVSEWVLDQYDTAFYAISPEDNPLNIPKTLYPRVIRGGSWKDKPGRLRCSARQFSRQRWKRRDPQIPKSRWWHSNASFVGFRIVRPARQPPPDEIKKYWLEVMDDY
jgi:formylglycine-generating enzyme required for sulfatase activity